MNNFLTKLKNKSFVVSLVSASILAVQVILKPMGVEVPSNYIMDSLNAVLVVLTIIGVVKDHG